MEFQPRKTETRPDWSDPDGVKIYTISALGHPVDQAPYLSRLFDVKRAKNLPWDETPAFVIFHDGAQARYLVLCWWGNDNELFTSVSVETPYGWVEDPSRFSFCLWDLEVIWHERNSFVHHIYCSASSLDAYRNSRLDGG